MVRIFYDFSFEHLVNGSPLKRVVGKNREIDLIRVEISMATKPDKVVYNITLQSEEDEEVKVIDRLHSRGLQ